MDVARLKWEAFHASPASGSGSDDWLEPQLERLRAARGPVLDLGCGAGNDTRWLAERGVAAVAADYSRAALARVAALVPGTRTLVHDIREPLPFAAGGLGAVVADLSLHYFGWETTRAIFADLRRALAPGGLLALRVNSTEDVEHGAGLGKELEPRLYESLGETKRFFLRGDLEELLAEGWETLELEPELILRYARPKRAWRAFALRV